MKKFGIKSYVTGNHSKMNIKYQIKKMMIDIITKIISNPNIKSSLSVSFILLLYLLHFSFLPSTFKSHTPYLSTKPVSVKKFGIKSYVTGNHSKMNIKYQIKKMMIDIITKIISNPNIKSSLSVSFILLLYLLHFSFLPSTFKSLK